MSSAETVSIVNIGKFSIQVLTKNSGTTTTFTNCNVKYHRAKSLALPELYSLCDDGSLEKVVGGRGEEGCKVLQKYDCQSTVNSVVYTWGVDLSHDQSDAFGLFDQKSFGSINTSEFVVITDQIVR